MLYRELFLELSRFSFSGEGAVQVVVQNLGMRTGTLSTSVFLHSTALLFVLQFICGK